VKSNSLVLVISLRSSLVLIIEDECLDWVGSV